MGSISVTITEAVDAVPYRLTCTVAVIEKMLAVSVVYKHHGEFELLCPVHGDKADNACGGLLAAADNVGDKLIVFGVDKVNKVAAVVDDDVGAYFNYPCDVAVIFLFGGIVPCKYLETVMYQSRSHIVLSGERVGACNIHIRTACCQHLAKVCCLCLQMNGEGYFKTCKGLGLGKFLFNTSQQGHILLYPLNFSCSAFPKLGISYLACV